MGTEDRGKRNGAAGMPSDISRVHVVVDGRVQGVWFRESARREADRLSISGWIRNLPDGRVEAVYEGPRQAVEEMVAWTNRGPERAHVTDLHIEDEEPQGERGFTVR